jgi:hypothetical protein
MSEQEYLLNTLINDIENFRDAIKDGDMDVYQFYEEIIALHDWVKTQVD